MAYRGDKNLRRRSTIMARRKRRASRRTRPRAVIKRIEYIDPDYEEWSRERERTREREASND